MKMEFADRKAVPLWEGKIPADNGKEPPVITPYFPPVWKCNHRALVIFPGGGYHIHAQYEGYGYAEYFARQGYFCLVVNYRLGEANHHPAQISDAARAVRLVRSHAAELNVHPDKIGVVGSSAGGHLAASVAVLPELGLIAEDEGGTAAVSSRPDFAVLCYPVITLGEYTHQGSKLNLLGRNFSEEDVRLLSLENSVSAQTPPCFLYHRLEDTVVPAENSMMFAQALRKNHIPFELHIYERGDHGGALDNGHPWVAEALRWIETL